MAPDQRAAMSYFRTPPQSSEALRTLHNPTSSLQVYGTALEPFSDEFFLLITAGLMQRPCSSLVVICWKAANTYQSSFTILDDFE